MGPTCARVCFSMESATSKCRRTCKNRSLSGEHRVRRTTTQHHQACKHAAQEPVHTSTCMRADTCRLPLKRIKMRCYRSRAVCLAGLTVGAVIHETAAQKNLHCHVSCLGYIHAWRTTPPEYARMHAWIEEQLMMWRVGATYVHACHSRAIFTIMNDKLYLVNKDVRVDQGSF